MNNSNRLPSDIVYKGIRKVLPKLTPVQLDSVQHEIRTMLQELDYEQEEVNLLNDQEN
jgi:hypothetical protein